MLVLSHQNDLFIYLLPFSNIATEWDQILQISDNMSCYLYGCTEIVTPSFTILGVNMQIPQVSPNAATESLGCLLKWQRKMKAIYLYAPCEKTMVKC